MQRGHHAAERAYTLPRSSTSDEPFRPHEGLFAAERFHFVNLDRDEASEPLVAAFRDEHVVLEGDPRPVHDGALFDREHHSRLQRTDVIPVFVDFESDEVADPVRVALVPSS